MNRLFGMMRYNKQLLIVFIFAIVDICFVLGVGIFDIVQLIVTNSNSAKLSPVFVPLNIALIVVVGITILLVTAMFVAKIIKGKKNEFKKD